MALVDAVVVSYNSRDDLRACVAPLATAATIDVIVVDNASEDGSLETIGDLPVKAIATGRNGGFAYGCNVGTRAGESPFILFLNPDSRIAPDAVVTLARILEAERTVGAVAPRLLEPDGSLSRSLRRFPRLTFTYSQALFLHRLFPAAPWAGDVIQEREAYLSSSEIEWAPAACLLVRRAALDEIGGMDEGFFHYCEDIDLCLRLHQAGYTVLYTPEVEAIHIGGGSAPQAALLPRLAASKLRFALKHRGPLVAFLERTGLGLHALTHALAAAGGLERRRGHLRTLQFCLFGRTSVSHRTSTTP